MINDSLLDDVKNYLDMTWDLGPDEKQKLRGIIARGMKYIDHVAGEECDYSEENKPRELLFCYCLYARSNALDEFQDNYLSELTGFQIAREVTRYHQIKESDP